MLMTHTHISLSQSNAQGSVLNLSNCLTEILFWMELSKVKLNPEKIDIIIDTKHQQNRVIRYFPVKLLSSGTFPSDTVRNLGIGFESDLNCRQHFSSI